MQDKRSDRCASVALTDEASCSPEIPETTAPGQIELASWLADDVLILVGWFELKEGRLPEVWLSRDAQTIHAAARCLSYPRPDVPTLDPRAGKLLVVDLAGSPARRIAAGSDPVEKLEIRTDDALLALELASQLTDLRTLLREGLAWLDAETRSEITAFLPCALIDSTEAARSVRLRDSLVVAREALRERLSRSVLSPGQRAALFVDTLLAVDKRSFYVKGWVWEEEADATRLTAVSPEGSRAELLDRAFRYPRPDITQMDGASADDPWARQPGFICYFELDAPSTMGDGWVFELRHAAGAGVETAAPVPTRDTVTVRNIVLGDLAHAQDDEQSLTSDHIHPAISRLQERNRGLAQVERIDQFGTPPPAPDVSIVVPLYRRVDFMEQQLAQFAHDPEIHRADLIYVLDSPELAQPVRHVAAQLDRLYRVPFRVVTLRHNVGFAMANNVAASLARGRLLLLLNSDVLPDRPGWLNQMAAFYDSTPGIGTLGPKLLYEDDSIQHAGLYFHREALTGQWNNEHHFKGLHRSLPAANVARPVPAVTAACMMIDIEHYQRLGGLSGTYVQGDFEDSDLCLRLTEAGYECWYLPTVELYHLEGQSYPGPLRQLTTRYNRWLHTHLWEQQIEAMVTR